MASIDEQILRATKEIVVKFIEVGRISPANFHENFKKIYDGVVQAVREPDNPPGEGKSEKLMKSDTPNQAGD